MTDHAHPIDALHDAVSGRLAPADLDVLRQHLAACDACRREFEAMTWLTQQARAAATQMPVPPDLAASLTQALDEEDARPGGASPRRVGRRAWLVIGGSAAAGVVGAAVLRRWGPEVTVPEAAAADLRRYAAGELALAIRTSQPAALAAYHAAASPGFVSDVYDFGMMAYALEGGGLHTLAGHTTTMAAYQGDGGATHVMCHMYPGRLDDLPRPARRMTTGGVTFFIYEIDAVTIVCWQSGPLVCVLAADGEAEAAIGLAVAKAVPA